MSFAGLAYVGPLPGQPPARNLRDKTPKDWKVRFGKCGQQMSRDTCGCTKWLYDIVIYINDI